MQITLGSLYTPCTQPHPRDSCTWLHPLIPAYSFCAVQLNLWSWVNWISLQDFAKNAISLECQRSVVSARDISRDFFRSRWASSLINLVCLLGWPFYTFLVTVIQYNITQSICSPLCFFLLERPVALTLLDRKKSSFGLSSSFFKLLQTSHRCQDVENRVLTLRFASCKTVNLLLS